MQNGQVELEVGCVVVVVVGVKKWRPLWWQSLWPENRRRAQVVGGPQVQREGMWRGFFLGPGQQPHDPLTGQHVFLDFFPEPHVSIEGVKWPKPISGEQAFKAMIAARQSAQQAV